jgi:membrane-associated phospholipid phosphatase
MTHPRGALRSVLAVALAVAACSDSPTSVEQQQPSMSAVKFWEAGSTLAWNEIARGLNAGTSPIAQVRVLAYLSVAQNNAIIAAEDSKVRGDHPSAAGAAAGASLVVLKSFFPAAAATLDGHLAAQQAAPGWPGEQTKNFAAGEAIGRAIGAAVVAFAATDNANLTVPPANPGGAGYWTGTNSIRGLYGSRTFALTSGDQFRPAAPPAWGSAEFDAALAEVRAFSDNRTVEQMAIASYWAVRGPSFMNQVAADLIVAHHRTEREAAHIMALANMAGFDVTNACFDAKFAYYLIRPSQADPLITVPLGLPNHPSYVSGHSCQTSAYAAVLQKVFPQERDELEALIIEAGLARIYAGLHYRFDTDAGAVLGKNVAGQLLSVMSGKGAIPLTWN